jgi:putative ABC transport system substrate-binding protein
MLPSAFRHRVGALLAALAFAAGSATSAAAAVPDPPVIAIVAIVDHPSVDAMRRGIGDALRAAGLPPGERVRLDYETADADPARAAAIARALADGGADIVVALSEPMARAIAAQPLRVPVVVAGISPEAADALEAGRTARLLTGIAAGPAHVAQMALAARLRPDARTVLVPWRGPAGAPPAMLRALVAAARTQPFGVTPWRVPDGASEADLLPAHADAATTIVYLAAAAVGPLADALIAEAARRALPVVADRRDLVVRGATASVVHDWYAIGRQAGEMVAAILADPTQARRPIRRAEARFLVVNGEAARDPRLRLAIRADETADEVIEWAQPDGPNPLAKPTPPAGPLP